jgi:hypothetical protein
MKNTIVPLVACVVLSTAGVSAQTLTLESAPPVVVKTFPRAGQTDVDPNLSEIQVTFSKAMADQLWSFVQWSEEASPEFGAPRYLADHRTCVAPVKLQSNKMYAVWINHGEYLGFRDATGKTAVPYLLTFFTGGLTGADNGGQAGGGGYGGVNNSQRPRDGSGGGGGGGGWPASSEFLPNLNDQQRAVLEWTDRQFQSFFDGRSFSGWDPKEFANYETKLIDALKGPHTREYFTAINTLGAMRSTNALPALRSIAYERADRNNRDRWMAIRSLGLIQRMEDVPDLIHLVYHGNQNTHWWAQISLVKITGQNFGSDWNAWAQWWKSKNGQPPFNPEIIKWWAGQPEPEKLAEEMAKGDKTFLETLKPKESQPQ